VPVVRLQEKRHQRVIDSGIYAVVRHPMYTGFAPFAVGPALWLGSYVAALLAIVPIAVLAVRSVLEEGFLERELKGYEAYMRKVRYRLIPLSGRNAPAVPRTAESIRGRQIFNSATSSI
jgi:protein-S-isoprenylcysteine O-methyltransferase Ste14